MFLKEKYGKTDTIVFSFFVYSLNAHISQGWPGWRRRQAINLPREWHRPKYLSHHLLILRVHIGRKLEAKLGLKSKPWYELEDSKWHLKNVLLTYLFKNQSNREKERERDTFYQLIHISNGQKSRVWARQIQEFQPSPQNGWQGLGHLGYSMLLSHMPQ